MANPGEQMRLEDEHVRIVRAVMNAGDAEDDRLPQAAERGRVHAAGGVAHRVVEIDARGLIEVARGGGAETEARRDERVHPRAERAPVRGARLVIGEVGEALLGGELVPEQAMSATTSACFTICEACVRARPRSMSSGAARGSNDARSMYSLP